MVVAVRSNWIFRCRYQQILIIPVTALLMIFSVAASNAAHAGVIYRVGPGCTYTSIQAAIDAIPSFGSGEIRIRSGTYTENLIISGKTVELIGGHGDCTTTSPTGITNINGSGTTSSVITFSLIGGASDLSRSLTAERLLLFNGTGNALAPGGGITVSTTSDRSAQVTLLNTFVRGNETTFGGGGISLIGSGSLALLENSQIDGNIATGAEPDGGGLYCSGDFSILAFGGSIFGNTAGQSGSSDGRGGGVFLDGCNMAWFAQNALAVSDDASLRNNTVYGDGAALFAMGGAEVDLIGASFSFGGAVSARPLRIRDNRAIGVSVGGGTAGGSGGAAFIEDVGTRLTVDRSWTYDNEADALGGAYAVRDGAVLEVIRGSQTCHTPRNCSRIFDNHGRIAGGAVDLRQAEALIQRTIVARNDSVFGGVSTRGSIYAFDSTIRIRDSLIHGDIGPGHTLAAWDSTLQVERTTIADTTPSRGVFGLNGTSTLTVFDSIVHEAGGADIVTADGGTHDVATDCVVWHDDALVALGLSSNTEVADPRFADRENEVYYLSPDSPAINYCGVAPPAPAVDIEWNPRGICHSVNPPFCPVEQIYDLGAYEFPLLLFRDRFESPFL